MRHAHGQTTVAGVAEDPAAADGDPAATEDQAGEAGPAATDIGQDSYLDILEKIGAECK
jgi:hypothetical protein